MGFKKKNKIKFEWMPDKYIEKLQELYELKKITATATEGGKTVTKLDQVIRKIRKAEEQLKQFENEIKFRYHENKNIQRYRMAADHNRANRINRKIA